MSRNLLCFAFSVSVMMSMPAYVQAADKPAAECDVAGGIVHRAVCNACIGASVVEGEIA